MQNTSTFIPCRICAARPGPDKGFYYFYSEATGPGYEFKKRLVVECDCHKAWAKRQETERKFEAAGVWSAPYNIAEDYRGSKSTADVAALKEYAGHFDRYSDKMVYMYGPNGTQKTTLAMWVAREVMQKNFSVKYILMETLSMLLSPNFAENDGKREAEIARLLEIDLLIIDEAFDRKTTTVYKSGYQIPFLTQFFKERFELNKKGMLFVSNVLPGNISSDFGAGLKSFVQRNVSQSTLSFEDVYIQVANVINPRGLFE